MLPLEELSPEIQDIMSIPMIGKIDANDVNADEARAEYYKDKYMLWKYSSTQIFSVGGELSDDYQNLLVAARKAVEFGYRYIEISIRTMVIDI